MERNFNFPPLVTYDIINNSNQELTLNIITEIEDFTNKEEDTVKILPYSLIDVNHTPLFSAKALELEETCQANLKVRAIVGNQIAYQRTARMELLASDTMIWEILNPLNREIFYLYDFLATWVTPHSKVIENVISIAKEYHKDKSLEGYQTALENQEISRSVDLQCEAIFMALKELGISYVDASLSFGWNKNFASQRIKLPFNTIKTKAANCIDGTVLFASLLEHVGIQPIVILVPRHALIGWRPYPNSNTIMPLETTLIASCDYKTAVLNGTRSLERGLQAAKEISGHNNMRIEEAISHGYIRFIEISSLRERKIFPRRTQ